MILLKTFQSNTSKSGYSRTATLAAIIMSLLASFSISGCGTKPIALDCGALDFGAQKNPPNIELAVVLAPTDSFLPIQSAIEQSSSKIDSIIRKEGKVSTISVIVADSNPRILARIPVDLSDISVSTQTDSQVRRAISDVQDVASCINSVDGSGIEVSDEVDFLQALNVASSNFDTSTEDKRIIVIGNGLQTTGDIEFQKTFPKSEADVKRIVKKLHSEGAISANTLSGIRVSWLGLGQTAGKIQKPLNTQSREMLQEFWIGIGRSSGGTIDGGDIVPGSIPSTTSVTDGKIKTTPVQTLAFACLEPILLDDDAVHFLPKSADFADPTTALQQALFVKRTLESSKCVSKVQITGYVASGATRDQFNADPEMGVALSRKRAEAFAKLLSKVGVGVPVETFGAGKGPTDDWDSEGNPVEELMKKNRFVMVTPL